MPFVCILLAKTRALAPENTPTPGARAREILLLLPEFKNEKKKKMKMMQTAGLMKKGLIDGL